MSDLSDDPIATLTHNVEGHLAWDEKRWRRLHPRRRRSRVETRNAGKIAVSARGKRIKGVYKYERRGNFRDLIWAVTLPNLYWENVRVWVCIRRSSIKIHTRFSPFSLEIVTLFCIFLVVWSILLRSCFKYLVFWLWVEFHSQQLGTSIYDFYQCSHNLI